MEKKKQTMTNHASRDTASLSAAIDAAGALARLREGNKRYLQANANDGDISPETIKRLFHEGQEPYACVITCADSRVVPEHVFMAGLGELFCVRVAGNVVGEMELASCIYAVEHLGVALVCVLGHTHCGAIGAALEAAGGDMPDEDHAIWPLIARIASFIGDERNPEAASKLNVAASVKALCSNPVVAHMIDEGKLVVMGALYHTHSGVVDFLDEALA